MLTFPPPLLTPLLSDTVLVLFLLFNFLLLSVSVKLACLRVWTIVAHITIVNKSDLSS